MVNELTGYHTSSASFGIRNSSILHVLRANRQVRRSWRLNGFAAPPLLLTRKLWSKVMQFFHQRLGAVDP